jgi:hypothetical protein
MGAESRGDRHEPTAGRSGDAAACRGSIIFTSYLAEMKPLRRLIELADPDIPWVHITSQMHRVRDTDFELQVSRIPESGQFRIYIASNGRIHAHIFDPIHDGTCDTESATAEEIVRDLLTCAIHDIDENKNGLYDPR